VIEINARQRFAWQSPIPAMSSPGYHARCKPWSLTSRFRPARTFRRRSQIAALGRLRKSEWGSANDWIRRTGVIEWVARDDPFPNPNATFCSSGPADSTW